MMHICIRSNVNKPEAGERRDGEHRRHQGGHLFRVT